MLLHDWLARAAQDRPDDEAIAFDESRLTWSQWHARVRRTTGALAEAGLGPGDRVAVIDRNHLACLDVLLAAGALGAATVVINSRLTDAELMELLRDSAPRIVCAGPDVGPRIDARRNECPSVERILTLDDMFDAWVACATPRDAHEDVSDDDVALVIYTSGTTGRPKGAEFTHAGLRANAISAASIGAMGPRDRVLVSMPLFHVGGMGAALTAIHAGVPLSLLRKPEGQEIVQAIEEGCTRAFLVPAAIATLLDRGPRERQALASLTLLTYGGAPCPLPLLGRILAALPDTHVVQVYGMTELCGTVTTLSNAAHRDTTRPERLRSAGQVIEGTQVRIVDPSTRADVPRGASGELWFSTPKRMVGYLDQPEATAETITDDGWVRTGDIGYVDDDGFIFIDGRLKDVIITGGENVYGLEVETVLASHPAVAEVAVIGLPDPMMGESVVAVVVAAPAAHVDGDELISYARECLAGFKCPRRVVVVESLPRNAAGKVLKRELRERLEADGLRAYP